MEAKTAGTERTERLEVRLTPAESAALAAAAAREGLATATWARRALRLAAGLLVAGVAGCAHAPRSIHTPTATDGAVWYVVTPADGSGDSVVRCADDENPAAAWECAVVPVAR